MTLRTLLAMRVTQKVQFYTYVHLYIISLCPHIHIIYINIYKYINAQVPPTHSLPNCMSYHVYKLYRNLYLLNEGLYRYFLARKKLWQFCSEPLLPTVVPGLAGAEVLVGRVWKEEKQQRESLQGTNILRYLEHHLVFLYATHACLAPRSTPPPLL